MDGLIREIPIGEMIFPRGDLNEHVGKDNRGYERFSVSIPTCSVFVLVFASEIKSCVGLAHGFQRILKDFQPFRRRG